MSDTSLPRRNFDVGVVTNRRRLVAACGVPLAAWPDVLVEQVAGAVAGGADLVYVREPDVPVRTLLDVLDTVGRRSPEAAARVVVADRADVALVAGVAGVHLSERSMDEAAVRLLPGAAPPWVVGRSVHSPSGAQAHRGVSYLLAGTVLPSVSKPGGWTTLGWDGLTAVVAAAEGTPVVAIGGLGAADVANVLSAGAQGMAAIGCFLPQGPGDVAASVAQRVREVRNVFDRAAGVT